MKFTIGLPLLYSAAVLLLASPSSFQPEPFTLLAPQAVEDFLTRHTARAIPVATRPRERAFAAAEARKTLTQDVMDGLRSSNMAHQIRKFGARRNKDLVRPAIFRPIESEVGDEEASFDAHSDEVNDGMTLAGFQPEWPVPLPGSSPYQALKEIESGELILAELDAPGHYEWRYVSELVSKDIKYMDVTQTYRRDKALLERQTLVAPKRFPLPQVLTQGEQVEAITSLVQEDNMRTFLVRSPF